MYQFRQSLYIDPSDSVSVKSMQVGTQKQDQIKYLTEQLGVLIAYNEKLEREIKESRQQNQSMKNSVVEKDKQLQESGEVKAKANSKLSILLSENEKLQDIVLQTNKHLKQQQQKVSQLQAENAQLKQCLTNQEEQHCDDIRQRTTELEEHYQLLQNIVSDLTNQVQQLCQEKESLQKQLDERLSL